ncbi:MAG: hypothetical protein DMG71_03465 [Acidobacteria bacterium]|nr:MAG: hypothetical protein DMG71_03465 [Acidobacteriota bacterium]
MRYQRQKSCGFLNRKGHFTCWTGEVTNERNTAFGGTLLMLAELQQVFRALAPIIYCFKFEWFLCARCINFAISAV